MIDFILAHRATASVFGSATSKIRRGRTSKNTGCGSARSGKRSRDCLRFATAEQNRIFFIFHYIFLLPPFFLFLKCNEKNSVLYFCYRRKAETLLRTGGQKFISPDPFSFCPPVRAESKIFSYNRNKFFLGLEKIAIRNFSFSDPLACELRPIFLTNYPNGQKLFRDLLYSIL